MVSTAIKLTNVPTNFEFVKETLAFEANSSPLMWTITPMQVTDGEVPKNFLDLRSEKTKVLLTLHSGMFHFWYDNVGPLLDFLNKNPDTVVLLDNSVMRINEDVLDSVDKSFYSFLLKMLDDMGVKHFEFTYERIPGIVINNCYFFVHGERIVDSPKVIYNHIKDRYIRNESVEPYRNVYISRKYMEDRTYRPGEMKPGLSFNHDNRIDDESILEKFFSENGFDIVAPEEFETFEDQINFFNEARTVISLTSSGLTNTIFMQPGTNLVELVTPLIATRWFDEAAGANDAEESLHHLYVLIAFQKGMKHFGIPNELRDAQSLVDYIKKHNLMEFINSL